MNKKQVLTGDGGPITIVRDSYGVPHIQAETPSDAWLGMGYACAQDRMFQMDYDRRRASGRWAEIAGSAVVSGDILARRLNLDTAAQRDVAAMSPTVREAFEAYAKGVNLIIVENPDTFETEAMKYPIEPWKPWHSIAAFKIRHVLMGQWPYKLAQAALLTRIGEDAFRQLDIRPTLGSPLVVPPYERLKQLTTEALDELAQHVGFLSEVESGSNAWAVSSSRTNHGGAILCNDSHRALDTPNVYWQCHVTSPDFNVIGATFPGLPGFPHFGHNGHVAWAITHADADTQDLYLEKFNGTRYLTEDGWVQAEIRTERIDVRGGDHIKIEAFETRHGPIVHGNPQHGMAIALKYTAICRPDRGLQCMLNMLNASNVTELIDSQGTWVDPVNNFVAADENGNIAYQCRGELPIRSSPSHRRLPVPGWDGKCEWTGRVPFSEMPRAVNPEAGFVITANNVIMEGDRPYISYTFAQPYRAERLRSQLINSSKHSLSKLSSLQTDTVSWPAQAWGTLLTDLSLENPAAEAARTVLAGWDGDLAASSPQALLYGCFRRALAEEMYRPIVGEGVWEWMASGVCAPTVTLIGRWLASDTWELLGAPMPADEEGMPATPSPADDRRKKRVLAAVPTALAKAWTAAADLAGDDPAHWRWGDFHQAVRVHPLAGQLDLDPLDTVPMGGDADTIQAAGYSWHRRDPFTVKNLSVYRQVVDLATRVTGSYVMPGGSSGDPRSPHFTDQLAAWAEHRRIPMPYSWSDINNDGL